VLFAITINGLLSKISSSSALYADDICLRESGSHVKHFEKLCQRPLRMVYEWCIESGFTIYASKSADVLFTKKRKPGTVKLFFANETISLVKEYQYSGVMLRSRFISLTHTACSRQMSEKIKYFSAYWKGPLGELTNHISIKYRTPMRSIVAYGMEPDFFSIMSLWTRCTTNTLRICTGALNSTTVVCLQHSCKEMPLDIKHRLLCFKYEPTSWPFLITPVYH